MSSTDPGPNESTVPQDVAIEDAEVRAPDADPEVVRVKKRILDALVIMASALLLLLILVLPFGWTLIESSHVSTLVAPIVAILIAGCILAFGALRGTRPELRVTMGGFGLGLAGVLLLTGTVLALVSGGGPGAGEPQGPGGTVSILATGDITFDKTAWSVPEGEITFLYEDGSNLLHTLTIEGMEDALDLRVNAKGDVDSGTVALPPGTYTLYCTIKGHREQGMEGELTVESAPDEPPPGGEPST
jgi:plastocyanin